MKKDELSLDNLLGLLGNTKLAEGKSPQAVEWYKSTMRGYMRWLESQGLPTTLEHFTLENVRAYIVHLQERPAFVDHPRAHVQEHKLSDHSINSYVRCLRAVSNWLHVEGYVSEPPLARLKMPKMSKKVQDILQLDEIKRIVSVLNPRTETGSRDYAMFILLLDTGMRAGELCALRLSDLHLDDGYAIVFGKGKKQRPVKIGARAAKAVRFYIMHWRKPALPHVDNVFLTCQGFAYGDDEIVATAGMPVTVNALGFIFKRLGKAAGVPRLHPHLLRHTFACTYLLRYRDPFALKSLLGHTTLAMTNHYCEAVKQMEIVQSDAISVADGFDLIQAEKNLRGRLPKKAKQKRG